MTAVPNQPPNHNAKCQAARRAGCKCGCRSLLHQRNILLATVASSPIVANYSSSLQNLYGYRFTDYVTPPSAGQPERNGRKQWTASPGRRVTARKAASRVEQRLVDVTLADVLWNLHSTPNKSASWTLFIQDLCLYATWSHFDSAIHGMCGVANSESGYFWAGMLAAAMAAQEKKRKNVASGATVSWPPSQTEILTEASLVPSTGAGRLFARVEYPRASVRQIKTVQEIQHNGVVNLAAQEIHRVLASPRVSSPGDAELLTCVVGATVCADLWHHPAACQYLLRRAVEIQRAQGFGFSLDGAPGFPLLVEGQIDQELGLKWRPKGSW